MEPAEIFTLTFLCGTLAYHLARRLHALLRRPKLTDPDHPATLSFTLPPGLEGCTDHIAVLAFTSRGELLKKIPQADVRPAPQRLSFLRPQRRSKCRVYFRLPTGAETICLLAGTADFCISNIGTYLEARQFSKPGVRLWYAERDVVPMIANVRTTDTKREAKMLSEKGKIELAFEWRKREDVRG